MNYCLFAEYSIDYESESKLLYFNELQSIINCLIVKERKLRNLLNEKLD